MNVFTYTTELYPNKDSRSNVGVLYAYRNGAENIRLEYELDSLSNRIFSPQNIFIFCESGQEMTIEKQYHDIDGLVFDRLQVTDNILIASYGYDGKITNIKHLKGEFELNEKIVDQLIERGIELLIEDTGTVLKSANGYVFQKPSLNEHNTFIRAGNMLTSTCSLAFLTHAVIRNLPIEIETIYIDSSTILALALSIKSTRARLAENLKIEIHKELQIENFHSYQIEENYQFHDYKNFVVLISATTSGSLASKLTDEFQVPKNRIWHLLAQTSNEKLSRRSVYFKKIKDQTPIKPLYPPKRICIRDEHFQASHESPTAVSIGKVHINKSDASIYRDKFYQENLYLSSSLSSNGNKGLFQLSKKTNSVTKYKEWMNSVLKYSLPSNIALIISTDDATYNTLGKKLETELHNTFVKKAKHIQLQDLQQYIKNTDSIENDTIIICCNTTSDGSNLLNISQKLRKLDHIHRHYIIGHAFPESHDAYRRLCSNLTITGKTLKYGLSCFHINAVGSTNIHNSWHVENQLCSALKNKDIDASFKNKKLSNFLENRFINIQKGEISPNDLFYPTPKGDKLKLRDESIFLNKPYTDISQASVYLLVSTSLQTARVGLNPNASNPEKADSLRDNQILHQNPFLPSVIDPDTFSRFNDGVIQAALLRAASIDELNYSSTTELSSAMLAICKTIFNYPLDPLGEAAYEFLYAIKTGKLQLNEEHLNELQKIWETSSHLQEFYEFVNMEKAI